MHNINWARIDVNGTAPQGRYGHTVVNYKNKLYLFGGHDGSTATNDLYIYDVEKNTWEEASTSGVAPSPRLSHSAAVIHDTMYHMTVNNFWFAFVSHLL